MNFLKLNYSELELELKEHVLWITFNRPKASNAFTTLMIDELVSVLASADIENDVRCMVITGSGKHFCAGGDVKQMQNKEGMFAGEPNELRERYKRGIQKIPLTFRSLNTPVVAMINGAAIGAGLDLACMCDIRICSVNAKFGETFTKLGLIPGDGGTYFLQRIVGFAKAMEMTITADIYTSQQALEMGLVSYVTSLEDLKEKTNDVVQKITSNAPIATQMAKRAVTHAYQNDLDSSLDLLAAFQGITQRTHDHFEGLKSIKENKKCDFNHQ